MNLTWHLIRNDLRAFRGPVLGWLALIATKLAVGVVMLEAGVASTTTLQWLSHLAHALAVLEFAALFLVVLVLQADSAASSKAFWLSRPISGGRLLRAKLCFLGLIFLVLPVVLTLPWWLYCGFDGPHIALAVLQTVAPHFVVIVVGLGAALFTPSLLRGLGSLVAAAIVFAVLTGAIEYNARAENWTRFALGFVVATVGLGAVSWRKYVSRRPEPALAIAAATFAALVAIGLWGPRSGQAEARLRRLELSAEEPRIAPPPLAFSVQRAAVRLTPNSIYSRPVPPCAELILDVTGVTAQEGLEPRRVQFVWTWPDGARFQADGSAYTGFSGQRPWPDFAKPPGGARKDRLTATAEVPQEMADRLLASPAECVLTLDLVQVGFASELVPRGVHVSRQAGSYGSRLNWLPRAGENWHAFLEIVHFPVLLFHRSEALSAHPRLPLEAKYEQSSLSWSVHREFVRPGFAVVGSVGIIWPHPIELRTPPRSKTGPGAWRNDLFLIRWTPLGRFTQTVRIPAFVAERRFGVEREDFD